MAPGIYRDKNGELCQLFVTTDGHYMVKYPDGRTVFI